ncbi:MAG: hypothetical protein FWC79_03460 [Oscillospiraceae bacterium]|nr:hypothetical protein [Oscillospiraceae bacterium]
MHGGEISENGWFGVSVNGAHFEMHDGNINGNGWSGVSLNPSPSGRMADWKSCNA